MAARPCSPKARWSSGDRCRKYACSSASVISNWLSVDGAVHSGSFAGILILSVAKNFRYDGAIAAILHPSFCLVVATRSEEHTSELQSRFDLVCRLLLEKKNNYN